jgi:hypothetical protein
MERRSTHWLNAAKRKGANPAAPKANAVNGMPCLAKILSMPQPDKGRSQMQALAQLCRELIDQLL